MYVDDRVAALEQRAQAGAVAKSRYVDGKLMSASSLGWHGTDHESLNLLHRLRLVRNGEKLLQLGWLLPIELLPAMESAAHVPDVQLVRSTCHPLRQCKLAQLLTVVAIIHAAREEESRVALRPGRGFRRHVELRCEPTPR